MIIRQRTSRALAIVALVSASGAAAFAAGQARKAAAANDTGSVVVATVNGAKITRTDVFDKLLLDQVAAMAATDPQVQERNKQGRQVAGIVGAVAINKMSKNGWAPVTVTRQEIMDFTFKDKSAPVLQTLDTLIRCKAVAQAAAKDGVSATAAEVAKTVSTQIATARQNPTMAGKSDAQILAAFGVRSEHVKLVATMQVNLENLVKKETIEKVGHPIGPGDFIAASHILIKVNAPAQPIPANPGGQTPKPADDPEKLWADGKKKAEGILADIRSGKITFDDAATQFSDDGSKFQKGSLGPFVRGQMVPEFDKAAFSQEKGKVGDLVRSPFGWHIIRVDKLGTELTAKEREDLIQRQIQSKAQIKLQDVMGKAKIDNKIKPPTPQGMGMPGMGQPPGRR